MKSKTIIAPQAKAILRKTTLTEEHVETDSDDTTPAHNRAMRRVDQRQQLETVEAQIAGHPLFHRNYKYPGADELYPSPAQAAYRFVDKIFPLAPGGVLLVDEPTNHEALKRAHVKHEVLKKMGFRHIIINKAAADPTTVEDCLRQLGEA